MITKRGEKMWAFVLLIPSPRLMLLQMFVFPMFFFFITVREAHPEVEVIRKAPSGSTCSLDETGAIKTGGRSYLADGDERLRRQL
jgi:hypothetical protein